MMAICDLHDDYLYGKLGRPGACPRCGQRAHLIHIESMNFPKQFGPEATILRTPLDTILDRIGLECGCYARLHRQITHIRDKMGLV